MRESLKATLCLFGGPQESFEKTAEITMYKTSLVNLFLDIVYNLTEIEKWLSLGYGKLDENSVFE